jgi:poly(A) polymerase
MEHLGVPPGPLVGEALRFLLEVRMEEGPLERDDALRRLDGWFAART